MFRRSLGLAALLGLCGPAVATAMGGNGKGTHTKEAGIIVVGELADEAQAALNSGFALLKRVLLRQGVDVVSHAIAVSAREASLELEPGRGRVRTVSLRGGRVVVDGETVGRYTPGGPLERAWRQLLSDGAAFETPQFVVALRAFRPAGLVGDDAAALTRIQGFSSGLITDARRTAAARAEAVAAARADSTLTQTTDARGVTIRLGDIERLEVIGHRLESLEDVGPDIAAAVRGSSMRLGSVSIPAGQRVDGDLVVYQGDADIGGEVTGHVIALFGNVIVHRGATIGRSAVAIDGDVRDEGGTVRGDIKTLAAGDLDDPLAEGLEVALGEENAGPRSTLERVSGDAVNVVAVFAALAMLGFGAVFFGRRYVEVIADTASHSFGRSLVVGMLGQLLVLPTFAMLIVGLVFTIVGILLLPFAAVGYMVAAVFASVIGYLAVAHAIGETVTRRRMAHGAFVRAPNAYGYLFSGLVGLLGLWALAALTGWLSPVSVLFKIAAALVTWIAATVGFGAVLLSRGGLRDTFTGKQFGEATDEYLWATPPATPTAGRMHPKA